MKNTSKIKWLLIIAIVILLVILVIVFVSFKIWGPKFLKFRDISERDDLVMYELKWDKTMSSTGVESTKVYYELKCDEFVCDGTENGIIVISDSGDYENDKLTYPKISKFFYNRVEYLVFRNNGGTDGWGSVSYDVFRVDGYGEVKRVETDTIFNTCDEVVPIIYKNNLIFPKQNGKCSDFLTFFNKIDYLKGLDNQKISLDK